MISTSDETWVPPPFIKEGFTAQNPMRGPDWDIERYAFSCLRYNSIEGAIRWCERMIKDGNFFRFTVRCPYHGNNIFWKCVCPLCNERYRMCVDYLLTLKKTVRDYCATHPELVGLETWKIMAEIREWTSTGRWDEQEGCRSSKVRSEDTQSQYHQFTETHLRAAGILGVPPDVPQNILKVRFRELIKQYHPDSVHHLGHEFRIIAEEKSKEIIWAHGYLASQRGTDSR